jgi:hypothetical protein
MTTPTTTHAVGKNQNQNPYIPPKGGSIGGSKGGSIGGGELLVLVYYLASATPNPFANLR